MITFQSQGQFVTFRDQPSLFWMSHGGLWLLLAWKLNVDMHCNMYVTVHNMVICLCCEYRNLALIRGSRCNSDWFELVVCYQWYRFLGMILILCKVWTKYRSCFMNHPEICYSLKMEAVPGMKTLALVNCAYSFGSRKLIFPFVILCVLESVYCFYISFSRTKDISLNASKFTHQLIKSRTDIEMIEMRLVAVQFLWKTPALPPVCMSKLQN